jgi:hypothetical protein
MKVLRTSMAIISCSRRLLKTRFGFGPSLLRPGIATCDGSPATLGLGDVRGLMQKY